MKLSDFDYHLPSEMIASKPARPRDSARLLDMTGQQFCDRLVSDLPSILAPGDLLVVNDTAVIPARLLGRRGEAGISVTLHKHDGGARWRVFAKPARKCRPDDVIHFGDDFRPHRFGIRSFTPLSPSCPLSYSSKNIVNKLIIATGGFLGRV